MPNHAPAVFFALAAAASAQLPPVPTPAENPTTPAKVVLGKTLFWDEQLSSDDTVACGTCHAPEAGGGDPRTAATIHPGSDGVFGTEDDIHGSPGIIRQNSAGDFARSAVFGTAVQATGRTAPTNLGSAYHADLFWDRRASSTFVDPETNTVLIPSGGALESQALGPIMSPVEMGHEGRTWDQVRQKLQSRKPLALARTLTPDLAVALQPGVGYPALFQAAFGDPAITAARIAFAIAAYQRTLVPDQTPFDRLLAGDGTALTPKQILGLQMFDGTARCHSCHPAPFFSDDESHNLGLRPAAEDQGLQTTTGHPSHEGMFKTPSLRNAGLRPRLFHNGQSPALADAAAQASDPGSVLNVYTLGGGVDRSNLDPFLLPLGGVDLGPVLDFVLHGLTDPRAEHGLPPFDHPTLRSTVIPPANRYGNGLAGFVEPDLLTTVPTFPGNVEWKLGLSGSNGTSIGYLSWSLTPRTPALVLAGIPIHVGPEVYGTFVLLQGPSGQPGLATFRVGIPDSPVLTDLSLFMQLFALDGAAPYGIAASNGAELTVRK